MAVAQIISGVGTRMAACQPIGPEFLAVTADLQHRLVHPDQMIFAH